MTPTWHDELTAPDAAAAAALIADATAADGTPPVSEAGRLRLAGPARPERGVRHLLARDDDGGLVAYAQVEPDREPDPAASDREPGDAAGPDDDTDTGPDGAAGRGVTVELAVAPGARRHGVGGTVVAELVRAHGDGVLRAWAHGRHPGAVALARRHGFVETRDLQRWGRALDGELPEVRVADGVRLRAFEPGRDEDEFVRVNNAAFAWHPEQGGWTRADVLAREAADWFDPAGFLLAVDAADDARVLGYHWTKEHDADLGEVYVLGVDPEQHGRGLGGTLTAAGLAHLRARGRRTVMLYVESDNTAALRTYRRLGFEQWDADVQYTRDPGA